MSAILVRQSWEAVRRSEWAVAAQLAQAAIDAGGPTVEAVRPMAIAQWGLGNLPGAIAVLESVAETAPPDHLFWSDLGTLQFKAEDYLHAAAAFEQSLALDPSFLPAMVGRGESLLLLSRHEEARPWLEECVRCDPGRLGYGLSLARCLIGLGRFDAANALLDSHLENHPNSSELLLVKASMAAHAKRDFPALDLASAAAAIDPDSYHTLANLAIARWTVGDSAGAFAAQRLALQMTPAHPNLDAEMLWLALHDPARTAREILELYRGSAHYWAARPVAPPPAHHSIAPDPERPLRVGYLTGEFVFNPAYCFLAPWLQHQDRTSFTSYYYMARPLQNAQTSLYRAMADHWRDVWTLNETQLLDLIREDAIDILVDLSGHFVDHRLPVFSRGAAPVQIAFPHFPATTGVEQFDYLLTDRWTTPPGTENEYAEKIYRLPSGYIVYQPSTAGPPPPVTPLPAVSNGFITYGLFQRPGKYHAETWDVVAALLRRVPGAKLLVHYGSPDLDIPHSRARCSVLEQLNQRGVAAAQRVMFRGNRRVDEHLAVIGEADIALDSFPYNGQTTTCDCLWMGVPVVNLRGATHAARVGQGLLERMGLASLSCQTTAEYVDVAARLGADVPQLGALRASLRDQAAMHLGDGARLAREIEQAYRTAWREWCARQQASKAPPRGQRRRAAGAAGG